MSQAMEETTAKKSEDTTEQKVKISELGLDEKTYIFGKSSESGLLWTIASFVGATAFVYLLGEKYKGVSNALDKLAKIPGKIHHSMIDKAQSSSGGFLKNIDWSKMGAAVAIGGGLSALIGHLAMVPGAVQGHRELQKAQDKYGELVNDNATQLKSISSQSEEIAELRAQLDLAEKQRVSLADRVISQRNDAASQTPCPPM